MLTHGWRRFAWSEVMDGDFTPLPPAKTGLDLVGSVSEGANRRPVSQFEVVVLHEKVNGGVTEAKTDENGMFRIENMALPDSTRIIVHAKKRVPGDELHFTIEPTHQSSAATAFLPFPATSLTSDQRYRAYVDALRERLAVDRLWGLEMPAYELGEITVTDTRIPDEGYRSQLLGQPDRVLRIQENAFVGGKAMEYLQRSPSGYRVFGSGSDIDIRLASANSLTEISDCDGELVCCNDTTQCLKSGCRPMFMIDGIESDICQVRTLNASEVEAIEILKGPNAAVYGARAYAGVVSFVTRMGDVRPNTATEGTLLSGYTKHREFYSPDYGVQSDQDRKPDLRSTLYWKPMVSADNEGVLHLRFYTGDRTGTWVMRAEGIDEYGRPLTYEQRFQVVE